MHVKFNDTSTGPHLLDFSFQLELSVLSLPVQLSLLRLAPLKTQGEWAGRWVDGWELGRAHARA